MTQHTPGTVVQVVNAYGESGIIGFVCKTKPTNGDTYTVQVLSVPTRVAASVHPGQRLTYSDRHLRTAPKR